MTMNTLALSLALLLVGCGQDAGTGDGSGDGWDDTGSWGDDGWGDDDGSWGDDDGTTSGGSCGGAFDGRLRDEADATHSFQVDQDREVRLTLDWLGSSDLDLHLLDGAGNELHRSETDGGGSGEQLEAWLQAGSFTAKVVQWDDVSADYELAVSCE